MSSASPAPSSSLSLRRPLRCRPPPPPTEEELDSRDCFCRLRPALSELPDLFFAVNAAEDAAEAPKDTPSSPTAKELEAALLPFVTRLEEALANHLSRYPSDKDEHRGVFELCILASVLTRNPAQLAAPAPALWALDSDLPTVSLVFLLPPPLLTHFL